MPNGKNLNKELLKASLALHYKYFDKPAPAYHIQLQQVEITAKREGGIPTYFPLYGQPAPPFPIILNPNYDAGSAYKPLLGDPLKCPTIAPSNSYGNYKGGMFGMTRTRRNGLPKQHNGYDIAAQPGTDVFSMYEGKVISLDASHANGSFTRDSFGNYVVIETTISGQVYKFLYGHFEGFGKEITVGSNVTQGQYLGKTGLTGNIRDVPFKHVHIEVWDSNNNKLDPGPFFNSKFDPKTGKNDKCK